MIGDGIFISNFPAIKNCPLTLALSNMVNPLYVNTLPLWFLSFKSLSFYVQLNTSSHPHFQNGNTSPPNRILLVTINNAMYPITVDILHQVFGSHGLVEKIVIFSKTKGLQALIQYNNIQAATSAKESLHGLTISYYISMKLKAQVLVVPLFIKQRFTQLP